MKIVYFDNAATTQVREEVLKEMIPYFYVEYGNPSSIYSIGRKAKKKIEESREKIAKQIGANSGEIYFTSCGSESDNLAIKGVCYASQKKHIITTKIEHHAVLETCKQLEKEGYKVTYLGVEKNGRINLKELEKAITKETLLISIMFANNEIGSIQPIKEIGEIARKNNIIFHTDAVQAMGNIQIDVNELKIDLLSMSAHKFYGPKGVGALYVRDGVNFKKIQNGGHQEKNKRAGTENVAGIVGMAKALEISYKNFEKRNKYVKELRNYAIQRIKDSAGDIVVNGGMINRLPGNINVSIKNMDSDFLLYKLDEKGICASTGSACNSGQSDLSHVLVAIGTPLEYISGSLRITLGEKNTKKEVDYFIECLKDIIKVLE
ncbi:MAG: cysteine desulfurase family protein [Clostridia bacterium]|nr:cysteine desulfurase family protein [Clostridia bacterium]